MSSQYTLLQQVQQWLDTTKLTLVQVDPALQMTATATVMSRLSRTLQTAGWVDSSGTLIQAAMPQMVQTAISLLVAAWTYDRAYSESTEGASPYSTRLERMAIDLLDSIEAGYFALTDDPVNSNLEKQDNPDFWPNTTTGASPIYDELGKMVGWAGSEAIKFRMGSRY